MFPSQNNSLYAADHTEVIDLLQAQLKDINKDPQHISSKTKGGHSVEMDSVSNSSLQESDSLNYFPSAVPESPSKQASQAANGQLASFHPPNSTQNPLSQFNSQLNQIEAKGTGSEMAVIISIGPSKEPVPLIRYEFYNSSSKNLNIEETNYELIMKSKSIQSKFSMFILDVCSMLQDSPTAYIEKLQMWLSFQSCIKSVQSLQTFDGDSDVLKAKTIPALLSSLHCYTSWYNYSLIADIARQFCGDKGSTLVEAYESELRDYLQNLIIHCPPFSIDHKNASQKLELLEVKVGWDLSTALLEDIAIFKHTLCQLCDLDPRFLVVRRIANTSFQMSWAIPKVATEVVSEAIELNSGAFFDNNIQAIKISGSQIDFKPTASNKTPTLPMDSEPSEKSNSQYSAIDESHRPYEGTQAVSPQDNVACRKDSKDSDFGTIKNNKAIDAAEKSSKSHHKRFRANRDKKALSVGTALPSVSDDTSCSSLLSEISKTLTAPNLLSYATPPPSSLVRPTELKSTSSKDELVGDQLDLPDEVIIQNDNKLSESVDVPLPTKFNPTRKSVSFLWRMLGRAKPSCHANIYVVSIQEISKIDHDYIEVRKGQHLKALYRVADKIFIETPSLEQGFVPYTSCRLSRKHYGSQSTLMQLSYLRLYPESPDGIDILPTQQIPSIKMVAMRSYLPSSQEEIQTQDNQTFTILYCDSAWIYAINENSGGLLPRSVCVLSQESQAFFKRWQLMSNHPFQSDFIMKYDEVRPAILDENPVSVASLIQKTPSKVGKIFTIVQNFVPTSPTTSNFTIRKGLRVKVVEESGQLVCVTTKTGVSFWIPNSHVRPARKSSVADKFVHS